MSSLVVESTAMTPSDRAYDVSMHFQVDLELSVLSL